MAYAKKDLALYGGPKAKSSANIPMFPGGLEIGAEEKKEVMEVLDNKYLFRYYGPKESPSKVLALEQEYAKYLGSRHCLALNSCTSALITALVAVGVGPGDEVIVPSYTFFATCAAVVAARAIPIVAEVDRSLTMDPVDLEKKITTRTKAIIPVHMRGMPAKMDSIMEIARRHSLKVIEDVAQANGGAFRGKPLGSFGDIGCFSLQFHKIITSGEGGVLATNVDLLYTRAQAYHDVAACWRKDRFAPPEFQGEIFFGVNFRMSELTGAVALAQFRKLDMIVSRMRRNKKLIKDRIRDLPGLEFREVTDEAGDTAICLIWYLPKAAPGGGLRHGAARGGHRGRRDLQQGRSGLAHLPALEDADRQDDAHGEGLPVQLRAERARSRLQGRCVPPDHGAPRAGRCTWTSRRSSPRRTASRWRRASAR